MRDLVNGISFLLAVVGLAAALAFGLSVGTFLGEWYVREYLE